MARVLRWFPSVRFVYACVICVRNVFKVFSLCFPLFVFPLFRSGTSGPAKGYFGFSKDTWALGRLSPCACSPPRTRSLVVLPIEQSKLPTAFLVLLQKMASKRHYSDNMQTPGVGYFGMRSKPLTPLQNKKNSLCLMLSTSRHMTTLAGPRSF